MCDLNLLLLHLFLMIFDHFFTPQCCDSLLMIGSVSILASFCVWTKSFKCKDAVNRDSTFRVMSVVSACKSEEFQVPCQPSRRSSHPVWTPICPLFHPSGRRVIPSGRQTDQHHLSGRSVHSVRIPYCIEKFLCQLASV
jgi:hypothetical protein